MWERIKFDVAFYNDDSKTNNFQCGLQNKKKQQSIKTTGSFEQVLLLLVPKCSKLYNLASNRLNTNNKQQKYEDKRRKWHNDFFDLYSDTLLISGNE